MTKGIIYYTDNRLIEPIFSICQKHILASGLPIVSCSLRNPINFGENYVLENRKRGYVTMVEQIIIALKHSSADYVFFCEHDVLYHKSHFNFIPPKDDTYYYNVNVWQWRYPTNYAITFDHIISLSGLCCSRRLALNHFGLRMQKIKEQHLDLDRDKVPQPHWARLWGYEPGVTKKNGTGFSSENYEFRQSEFPNIDIRHKSVFSGRKTRLEQFRRTPTNWREITIDKIPGWNLGELFKNYLYLQ